MLSIQEMVAKTEQQRKEIKQVLGGGVWHPEDASIFDNQKQADYWELKESLHNISLSEFLAKSGTTGISGGIYMIPDKIHDTLIYSSKRTDKVPLISAYVVERWKGGDLKPDIVSDTSYIPFLFSSGGKMINTEVKSMRPTLTPVGFALAPRIGGDLIEDNNFDLIQYHVEKAGQSMGEYATSLALTVLKAGADGWGTLNSAATGDSDETKLTNGTTSDIVTAVRKVGEDNFVANTLVTTCESWGHSISMQAQPTGWNLQPPAQGFNVKIGILDVLLSNDAVLHASTDAPEAAFTNCISIIFDRNNAMLTGRKRWMQIENFSNPWEDLAGAVVSCRQDSVTLYDDSIYTLTET
jgi:hypothetical protein